jgi:hypothetical protein
VVVEGESTPADAPALPSGIWESVTLICGRTGSGILWEAVPCVHLKDGCRLFDANWESGQAEVPAWAVAICYVHFVDPQMPVLMLICVRGGV